MEKRQSRPPIVTVLGHVDHGKTTLLDAIRKTSVAAREAGGITQSIGASIATTKEGKSITFIDTPGHAAFGKMRSRGSKVADIAILVVAAEDGVKPQTLEALQLIKEAQIPFIVAITKIDLPSADVEGAKSQLTKQGVNFEGMGGDTPVLPVSGKTGKGVEELLETITLLSEVSQIEADPKGELEAVVIETQKDKRGPLATAVVRNGTLRVGEPVFAENVATKVRGLFNYKGTSIKEALPGEPVQILGFEILPPVGAKITSLAGEVTEQPAEKPDLGQFKLRKGEIAVIIKAKSTGSLEAVLGGVPAGIVVVDSGVGDIFESDVLLAKSSGVGRIFAFESGASTAVKKLARAEGVVIEEFKIIYELFLRLEELVKKGEVEILGKAEIVASFPFDNKKIAGARVVSGKIAKTDTLTLLRGEKRLARLKSSPLKNRSRKLLKPKPERS